MKQSLEITMMPRAGSVTEKYERVYFTLNEYLSFTFNG
jgi:hypothetical protein